MPRPTTTSLFLDSDISGDLSEKQCMRRQRIKSTHINIITTLSQGNNHHYNCSSTAVSWAFSFLSLSPQSPLSRIHISGQNMSTPVVRFAFPGFYAQRETAGTRCREGRSLIRGRELKGDQTSLGSSDLSWY